MNPVIFPLNPLFYNLPYLVKIKAEYHRFWPLLSLEILYSHYKEGNGLFKDALNSHYKDID